MWEEMLEVIPRMMVEEPFRGCDGRFVTMPPRNVVPKPAQKPHPPLWVACSRRDTIHLAAEKAIGALTFSFIDASEARHWVSDYYATFENAVPAGFAANPNLAIVTNFMCDRDEDRAIVDQVAAVAERRGLPRAQVALAWLLHQPVVSSPIVGVTKPQHLADAVAAVDVELSTDELDDLGAGYVPHAVAGHR